ncbi:hypothetical protein EC844_101190 [Acinetobacter calcoaceticus]|uniref:Uncharacterized protein n=1 Tax=Acinetobacter calcoaceticus TaxID=471 RepID=A0A4R1Y2W3_ACICA|nr:hypothetical protein EC844_101190 [Acinetobacter calcoaceticus]
MKALLCSDDIHHLHGSMLKSVMLVMALLPAGQFLLEMWQSTSGGSQIIVGFIAVSLFSALSILGFISALLASQVVLEQQRIASMLELRVLQAYRHLPMLFLMAMLSYWATQI